MQLFTCVIIIIVFVVFVDSGDLLAYGMSFCFFNEGEIMWYFWSCTSPHNQKINFYKLSDREEAQVFRHGHFGAHTTHDGASVSFRHVLLCMLL